MIPDQQQEYIITAEELRLFYECALIHDMPDAPTIDAFIRSRPYNPQQERERVLEELHGVVKQLYDAKFRNPLATVECAIAYMKDPTVPGHPEKQKLRSRGGG